MVRLTVVARIGDPRLPLDADFLPGTFERLAVAGIDDPGLHLLLSSIFTMQMAGNAASDKPVTVAHNLSPATGIR